MPAKTASGLLAVLLLVAATSSAHAELRWDDNLDRARQQAMQTNRLVLVHFGAAWCMPCQKLLKDVFNQPGFGVELEPHFVAVKLNVDDHKQLAQQLGVRSIPADVIMTPGGQVLQTLNSPSTAHGYTSAMLQIASTARPAPIQQVAAAQRQTAPAAISQPEPQQHAVAPAYQPSQAAGGDDRYADYYRQRYDNRYAAPAVQAPTAAQESVAAQGPAAGTQPQMAQHQPAVAATSTPVAPPVQQGVAQSQPAAASQPPTNPAILRMPPGCPPVALEGFCPVSLVEGGAWLPGDAQWGAIHRGRTYLFATLAGQQKFLADPDRFSPVIAGNDPVMALERGEQVPGRREHGVFYNDRIYLFANEGSLGRFSAEPQRFVNELQALRHVETMRR